MAKNKTIIHISEHIEYDILVSDWHRRKRKHKVHHHTAVSLTTGSIRFKNTIIKGNIMNITLTPDVPVLIGTIVGTDAAGNILPSTDNAGNATVNSALASSTDSALFSVVMDPSPALTYTVTLVTGATNGATGSISLSGTNSQGQPITGVIQVSIAGIVVLPVVATGLTSTFAPPAPATAG